MNSIITGKSRNDEVHLECESNSLLKLFSKNFPQRRLQHVVQFLMKKQHKYVVPLKT
jgi:hypothetical protein